MFITAVDMADDSCDEKQLVPMIEQAEETTGTKSEMTLADAAYHSGKGLEECTRRGQSVAMPETRQQLLGDPYHKDRFIYDQPSDSFMCPQGQRLEFSTYPTYEWSPVASVRRARPSESVRGPKSSAVV